MYLSNIPTGYADPGDSLIESRKYEPLQYEFLYKAWAFIDERRDEFISFIEDDFGECNCALIEAMIDEKIDEHFKN